jgi:ABC-type sugar transport system ATPase subunit
VTCRTKTPDSSYLWNGAWKSFKPLRRQGLGIIYISHRLDEIFAIADRVLVLRDGQHVATRPVKGVSRVTAVTAGSHLWAPD